MPKPKIELLIQNLEARIPKACAEDWDQVGLICGNAKQTLTGIVVGVDLTLN